MWSKFTGKSNSASQDGRRKGSSSNTRRRESVVSSNSTRKPARGDDKPPPPSSRNSYPPPESTTSSYATAPDAFRFADPSRYDSMPENLTRARSEYDTRSVVEDDRRSTRGRRARSSSRERKKDRKDRSRSRDRDDKKKDKKKKDDSNGKSRKESKSESRIVDSPTTTRAGDDLRANGSFSAQIGTPGFSAFPGQVGAPVSPKPNAMSAHVADQFPGQNPSQYTEPFQSPYGAAAEYYLDQGQSVASQPGVRPSQPLVNADPHLITPTAASNPPSETGQGAAMDFFTGKVSPVYPLPTKPPRPNQTMPGSFEDSPPSKPPRPSSSKPSKPSKTSKPSGSSKPDRPSKTSTAAGLATGAALGYAVGHHNSHSQTESQYISAGGKPPTQFYQHGSGVPNGSTDNFSIQAQSSEYASHADPASATLNVYGPSASGSFSTPGKTSHSHSNIPMYAAGAAGLAAGAYGLHAGSHNQNLPLPPGAFPSSPRMSPAPFAAGVTTMRHQHQGPISKIVDWWKDHEDVRKMEEYTEYIGVCRDCFDPRSSAMDAPRKHHYHSHGRRSNESHRGRIDKDSRYYSSDNDRRKSNKGSWIATGLAGYGLAKVGKQLFNSNRDDFDDTYSVKSGRYQSKASVRRHSRSRSRDRKSRTSYGVAGAVGSSHRGQAESSLTSDGKSYKIVRRHSRSRSRDRKEDPQYKITRRRSRSRSSSRSRGHKNGLIGAALGAAVGASVAGKSSKHRSRSNSPSGSFVRRRPSGGRDKRRSQEGLGSVLGLGRTDNRRSSRRSDASSSYVDISRTSTAPANTGFIAGFFSTPEKTEKRRKVHSKKRKGFFNFSNASSSSSDNGLAYGAGFAKARKPKRKSSDDKLNATLAGLGATAAALAVAQHGRGKTSSNRRRPEVVAVKESKGRRSKHGRRGSSSSDEDGWESASDAGDDSSSVNSGLAFGDYDFKGKGKSTESLVSNDSGTSKWLWRWGSKKKTNPSPSLTHQNSSSYFGPAAAGVAGAAVGAALGRNESAMSSHSSVPTMQTVFPVSTNDRYNFDAQPIVTSRPDNIPLQQPQPVVPVTSAVYSTSPAYSRQTDYTSSYVKPTGPPVFSNIQTPSQKYDNISNAPRPTQDSDDYGRPKLPKRGHSSPTQSSFKRDAAIAGVAAAAGVAVASHKRKQPAQSPGAVRFDLTEEEVERDHKKRKDQERKDEEREKKRQDLKRKEDGDRERERERERVREFELQRAKEQREEDARREYERERTRKQLEGEEIRRREDERREAARQEEERRRADETRKEAERRQSLIEAERHQRELTAREERRQSMIEAERLQREQNERDERDRRAREAIEAERRAELDRESRRQAVQAETNRRELLEREVEALRLEQERLERQVSASSVKPQNTGDSQRSWNLENRQRELENREKDVINPDDWKKSAATAVGGAAVASVVASAIGSSREKDDDSKRRGKKDKKKKEASREGSPKLTEDELPQKPISSTPRVKDVENERSKPEKTKSSVTEDADRLVKEISRRYSEDAPSQAEFFAPPELTSPSAPASPRISPDADAEVYAYPAHGANIMIVEPPRQPPYETPYSFTTDSSGYDPSRFNLPWPVPSLKLIMPTPPGSIAGSVTGGRSPGVSPGVSPVIQPQDAPKDSSKDVPKDVPKDLPPVSSETPEPAKSSSSKVRWGEPETFHYQPATPESFREQYISRDDLSNSNDRPYSREETTDQQPYYRYEKSSKDDSREERVEERYDNRKDSRDRDRRFEEAGTPDTEDEIVSSRPYDPTQKVYESQTPEIQPVVVEPSKSVLNNARFYQQPFYESASDIGVDTAQVKSDAPSTAHGYVEGEITEEPEEFFEATSTMPGGFIDDEEPETKPETKPEKPLTKKEKRKLEKSKRKESLEETTPESANGVSSQNGNSVTRETEAAPAVPIEWETNTTKKDKKKKKRGSTDRDIRDIEPESRDSSHEGDVGLGETIATAGAASVLAGVVAQAIGKKQENGSQVQPEVRSARTDAQDESSTKENGRRSSTDEEKYRTIPSNAFDDVEELADVKTPSKKGKRRSKNWSPVASPLRSQVGWEDYVGDRVTPEAAATVIEPTQTKYEPKLETTAFPDFDTKVDATRPGDYEERKRSQSLEKVPEVQDEWKTSKPAEREPGVYDERRSSKSSEKESSVYDERRSSKSTERQPNVYDERQSSKSTEREPSTYDERRSSKSTEREPSVYDDARSVKSDSRYDEDRERRHSKHRESRGDESRSTIDDRYEEDHERRRSKHRDSSHDAAYKREDEGEDGEHKRRHRRRESEREKSPSPSDKYKRSSIVSEPSYRYDDDGEEKKRHKHRKHRDGDKERSTSPLDKYKRSSAASEPGDLYESSHKSRRRSKRDSVDFDDTASVASSPAKYNEEKKEKKGGIFGLLSGLKSTDSLASTSKSRSKDSRNEDDDPERKRKKKHRSSTAGSTYGSDDDDRSKSERKERRHRSSVAGSTYGSDDDDRKSERREKRRSRDAHREGDQSFLGERAVETTKLPINLSTTPATKPVPEFHSYEELFQDSLIPEGIPLPISRPSSPSGMETRSRDALTSPSGVTEPAPLTTPPSLSLMRASSTTAVPFRLRRPPPSPSTPRSESWTAAASSPVVPSPGPVPEIQRRHSRGDSAEIKRKSGEIKQTELRPFYLLESTRKVHDVEESLPSLPPSIPSSRSPSIQGSEGFETESADNWESAVENPDESGSEMFHSPAGSRVGLADTPDDDDEKDFLDSQQATPKASEFPSDVKAMMQDDSSAKHLPEQPNSPRSLAHEMLQKALAAEAYESAKSTGIDSPESDAAVKTSTFSREALEDAATAVLVGGSVAAIAHELLNKRGDSKDSNESISKDLSQIPKDLPPQETKVDEPLEAIAAQVETRQPPDEDYFDDFMSGAPNEEDLHLAPVKETEEAEPAPIPPSPSSKSSKKGKKAKRGSSISSVGESAKGMTADELQTIREQDAEFGVGSWFEEPKTPKAEPPSEPEKTTPTTTTTIPDALMRRDSLKGKKKKAAKKGKRGLSISEEPELSLAAASGPSTDSEQPGDVAREAAIDETSDSKDDTARDETKGTIRASSVEFGPPLVLEPTASSKDIAESTPLTLQPGEDLGPGAETLPSEDVMSPADEAPGGVQLGDSIIPEAPVTFGTERDIRMEEISPEQSGDVTPVISSEAEKPVPRNKKSKKRNGKKVNELAQLYEPEAPSSSLSSEPQQKDNDQPRSLDQLREVEAVSEPESKPTQDKPVETAESQPVEQPVSNLPSGAEADLESSWTDTSKKQKKKSKKDKKRQSIGLDTSEAKQAPRESSELPADISSTQETPKDLPEPEQISTVEVDDTIPPSGDKDIDTTQDRAVLETSTVLDDKDLPGPKDSKALPTGDLPTEGLPTQELLKEPLHTEALPTDDALKASAPEDTAVEAKSLEKAPGLEDVTPSAPPTTEAPTVKPVEENAPAQQSSLFGRISGWFGKKETPEAPKVDFAESTAEQSSAIVHAVTETADSVLDKEVVPSTENIGKDTALDLTSKEATALEPNTKLSELVNESAPESLGLEQDIERSLTKDEAVPLKQDEEALPSLESHVIPDLLTTAKPVEAKVTTPLPTDSAERISTPVAVEEPADDEQWGFTPTKKGKKSKGKNKSINEPQPALATTSSQTKQEPASDVTKVDIDTTSTANELPLEGEQRELGATDAAPMSSEDPADSTEPISTENSEWAPLTKKSKKKKGKDKRVSLVEEPQIAKASETSTTAAEPVAHSQTEPTLEAQPESTVDEIAETIAEPVDKSLPSTEQPPTPSYPPKEEPIPEESTSFDDADSKSKSKKKAKKGKGKGKRGSITEEPKDISIEPVPSAEDVNEPTAVSKELDLSGPGTLEPVTETSAIIDDTGTVEPITSENQIEVAPTEYIPEKVDTIEVPSTEGNRELPDTTEAANLEEVIPTQVTDATISEDLDEPTASGKKKNKKGKGKRKSTVSEPIAETAVPEPTPKTVAEHAPEVNAESIPEPAVRLERSIDQSADDAMAFERPQSPEFAVDLPETIQEIAHQAEGEPPLGPVEATLDEVPPSSDPRHESSLEESQSRGDDTPAAEEEWPVSSKKAKKGKKGNKGKASGTVTPKEPTDLQVDRSLVDETLDSKDEDTTAITSGVVPSAAAIAADAAQEPQAGLEAGEDEWAPPVKRGKKDKKGKKKEAVPITPETTTTVDAEATPDSIEAPPIDATTPATLLPEQAADPTDLAEKAVPSSDDRTMTTADDSVLERPIAAQATERAVEDEIASSSKKSKKAKKDKKNKRASGTVTPIAPIEPISEPSEEPVKDSSFTERSEEPQMQPEQPRELDDMASAVDDSMAKDAKDSLAPSTEVDLTSEAQPTQPAHDTVPTPDQGSADEFFETSTLPRTQETTAIDPDTPLEPQEIPLSKEISREVEEESVAAQPSGKKSKKGKKSKRGSLADVTPLQDPAITSSEQISTEPEFSAAQTQETPVIEQSVPDVTTQIGESLPSEQTGVAPEVPESSGGEAGGKKGKKGKKSKRGSIPSTPFAEEPIVEAAETVPQALPAADVSQEKPKDPQESTTEQQIDKDEAEEDLWGESSGKKKKKKSKKSKRDSEISTPANETADLEQLDPEKQDDIIVSPEAPPITNEPFSDQTQDSTWPTTKGLEIEPAIAEEVQQTVSPTAAVNEQSSSDLPVDPSPPQQPLEETQFAVPFEDATTEFTMPAETRAASLEHPPATTVETSTEGFQEPTGKKSKKGKKSRKNSAITTPVETLPDLAPVKSSSTQIPNVDDTATSLPREIPPVDEAETPATPVTELPVETPQSDALENEWAPPKKGKKAKSASGAATPISTEPEVALQDTSTELPVDQAPQETTTAVEPIDTITDQPQASLDKSQVDDTEEFSLPSKKSKKGKAAKRALVPDTTVESSPQPDNLFVAPSDEQVAVSEDVIKAIPDSRPEPSNTEAQTLQESLETAAPVPTDESRDLALETPGTEATPEDFVPIPTKKGKKGKKGKQLSILSTPPAVTEPEPEPITVDEASSTAIPETPNERTSQSDDISREVESQASPEPTEEWGFTSKKAKKAKKGKRASGQATPALALEDRILSKEAIPTEFDVAAKDDDSSAVPRAEESGRDVLEEKAEVVGVEPATEEPKIEEPKSQGKEIEQAVIEEPKIEQSATEKSSVEEQKTEELQKEEPKLEDITFKEPTTLDEDRQVKQALPAEEEDLWAPLSKKKGKKNKKAKKSESSNTATDTTPALSEGETTIRDSRPFETDLPESVQPTEVADFIPRDENTSHPYLDAVSSLEEVEKVSKEPKDAFPESDAPALSADRSIEAPVFEESLPMLAQTLEKEATAAEHSLPVVEGNESTREITAPLANDPPSDSKPKLSDPWGLIAAAVKPDQSSSTQADTMPAAAIHDSLATTEPTVVLGEKEERSIEEPVEQVTSNKGKKEKKKGKKSKATSFDEPKATSETPVEDETLEDPAVPLAEGFVESKAVEETRNILAEGHSANYATEPLVLEDQSQPLRKSIDTDLPLTEEPASLPVDTFEQSKEGDTEFADFALKKTKKEKRKSKKGKTASWSEPETPAEPADVSEPLVEKSLAPPELPTIASVPELPQPDLSLPDSTSHLEASLGASEYQDSGYQSRVLPEQPAESSKEPELSTIPETAPIGSQRRSPSPRATDFAATLMAGLEDSGFPSSLVTKNPEYFQESSPPQSAAEPEPEEVFTTTSRKKKGKKGKQSRAASIGGSKDTEIPAEIGEDVESKPVQTREEVEPTTTTKTETSSKDSALDAAIAAGIALAGLSASHSGRTSPTEALPIEPEAEITWQKRPKKGKKGRASQSETPTESQEPIAVEIPVLDAATSEGLPRANPSDNVSESKPAAYEDEPFLDATETFQDIPLESKQSAKQGTTSEPSAPADLTASRDLDAEPEDQSFSLSKKKTKKTKKEKKRSLALDEPLPLPTESQQPDTDFEPPTSTPIEAAEASESIPQSQHVEAPIGEDSHRERTILDDTRAQSASLPLEVPISDVKRDLSTEEPPTEIAGSAQLDHDFGIQPKKTKRGKKGRKDTAASEPSSASDDIFVQESLQEEPGTLKELEDQPSTSQEPAWEPLTRKKSKKGKKAQKDTPVVVDAPTEASAIENDDVSRSREAPVVEGPLDTQEFNIEDTSRSVDDLPAPVSVLPSETALPIDSGIDPKEFSSKPVQPVNPTTDEQPPVDVGFETLGRKKSKKGKKGRKSTLDWADEEATSEVPPASKEQEPSALSQPEVAPFITQPEPAIVDEPAPTVEEPSTTAPTLPAVRQLSAAAEEEFPFPVQEKSIVEPEVRDETIDASREVEATPSVEKEDDEWAFTASKGKGKKGKKAQADVAPVEEESKESFRLVDSRDTTEGEFGTVIEKVEPEERGSPTNEEDWSGISIGKKNKKNKKGKKSSGAATPITETADLAKDIALGAIAGGLLSKAFDDDKPSTDEKPKSGPEVTSRKIEQHDMPTQEASQAMPLSIDTTGPSITKADNKLADRFPGLERVKRRAPQSSPALEPREKRIHLPDVTVEKPTQEPDIIAIPKDIPRSSTEDALPLPQDPASLSAESAAEFLNKELHKARSDRSLKEVLEPTWSFPDNRDSGLHVVDSPRLAQPQTGGEWVRDSGFHDAPLTPVSRQSDRFEQESDDAATQDQSRSIQPTVDFSMGDAEHVDISERQSVPPEPTTSNVGSEWALPMKKQRRSQDYSERDLTQSVPYKQSVTPQREISPTEEASPEFPSASAGMTTPSAVDSTTKQRASYLFKSSPSVQFGSPAESPATERRETPRGLFASAASTPASQKQPLPSVEHTETSTESHVDEPSASIFGDGPLSDTERSAYVSSPFRHMRSPSVPLDTIREYSPEDSPLSKKSREVGDVGAPERGVKSRRKLRGSIQEEPISDQLKSPPRTPIGKTIGGEQPRETSKPPISTDQLIEQLSWPEVDEDKETVGLNRNLTLTPSAPPNQRRSGSRGIDPVKQSPHITSPTSASDRSGGSINRFRTPDHLRPLSASSNRSSTPPLRRVNRSQSSDLRAAAKLCEPKAAKSGRKAAQQSTRAPTIEPAIPGPSTYDPAKDKGKGRAVDMADVYEGWGDSQASPMSPTRPPSVRKRQSMQIIDLEAQLRMMEAENRKLLEQSARAEESVNFATQQQTRDVSEQVEARDRDMRAKDVEIAQLTETLRALQEEVNRLTEINEGLTEANRNLSADTNARYATLQEESSHANSQWQASLLALEALRVTHSELKSNMEKVVGDEINSALAEKTAEIERLNRELQAALVTIEQTKQQILSSKEGDSFLTIRDEDYFDSACQQLCQHVQSWVLRFSKYSDKRACRLSSDIRDDKIEARLDNAILDGSDVDDLLRDRQKRRDVFMSVVMTMVWEFVFTRYLFGMDRDQRQKLKALEKQLSDIGPQRAVAHWRAITLTLLSKRDAFKSQRSDDTEAVVLKIYATLAKLLPPPSQYVSQIQDSLHNILKLAVTLSIEMRSQRAEYIMLPPLQPDYDTNGDLVRKVHFNASLMNERSGDTSSNEELEQRDAVVRLVLFPLVVKKGNDVGEGDDEIVVCPAQVLVAKPKTDRKVVRVLSGAMQMGAGSQAGRSVISVDMRDADDV